MNHQNYQSICKNIWQYNLHWAVLKNEFKLNPKFIYTISPYTKNITYHLHQVMRSHVYAAKYIVDVLKRGQNILYFTKEEAVENEIQTIHNSVPQQCFYIYRKWINGVFSNFNSIRRVVNRFKLRGESKQNELLTKKEISIYLRKTAMKKARYNGIWEMNNIPKILILYSYSDTVMKEAVASGVKCVVWNNGDTPISKDHITIFGARNSGSLKILNSLILKFLSK